MRIKSIIGYDKKSGKTSRGAEAWGEVMVHSDDGRYRPIKLSADQLNRIFLICMEV